jgi:hypothetical protein
LTPLFLFTADLLFRRATFIFINMLGASRPGSAVPLLGVTFFEPYGAAEYDNSVAAVLCTITFRPDG